MITTTTGQYHNDNTTASTPGHGKQYNVNVLWESQPANKHDLEDQTEPIFPSRWSVVLCQMLFQCSTNDECVCTRGCSSSVERSL